MKKVFNFLIKLSIILTVIGVVVRNPVPVFFSNDRLTEVPSEILIKKHVQFLVETNEFRNFLNPKTLNQVAGYIQKQFKENCPETRIQNYNVDGKTYKNVICFFKGKLRRRIVIGAHYDVAGEQNGADDNASGVAGIIELTRVLKENKIQILHDLEIVAYTLEEPPYFRTLDMGSYIHAKSLKESNTDIAFMLSVEMIGYFSDDWWSQIYPAPLLYLFYPISGNFITLLSGTKEYWPSRSLKKSLARSMDTSIYSLSGPSYIQGIDFSDHLNYWKFGYDGFMLTDTSLYRNPNYHKPSDTIETLNFTKIADIVGGLHGLVTAKYD